MNNPTELPDPVKTRQYRRTFYQCTDHYQARIYWQYHDLCLGKRGILINQSYLTQTRVELIFEMPLDRNRI